jgi:hypothetical protein
MYGINLGQTQLSIGNNVSSSIKSIKRIAKVYDTSDMLLYMEDTEKAGMSFINAKAYDALCAHIQYTEFRRALKQISCSDIVDYINTNSMIPQPESLNKESWMKQSEYHPAIEYIRKIYGLVLPASIIISWRNKTENIKYLFGAWLLWRLVQSYANNGKLLNNIMNVTKEVDESVSNILIETSMEIMDDESLEKKLLASNVFIILKPKQQAQSKHRERVNNNILILVDKLATKFAKKWNEIIINMNSPEIYNAMNNWSMRYLTSDSRFSLTKWLSMADKDKQILPQDQVRLFLNDMKALYGDLYFEHISEQHRMLFKIANYGVMPQLDMPVVIIVEDILKQMNELELAVKEFHKLF